MLVHDAYWRAGCGWREELRRGHRGGAEVAEKKLGVVVLEHAELSEQIIGGAIEVHRSLGPGLLESAYEACLAHELESRGLDVQRQVLLPVAFKEVRLDCGYRIDLLVNDLVVLELKCVEKVLPIHTAQLMTYLKLAGKPLGFLLNFNVPVMREGITRRVLTQTQVPLSASSAPPR